MSFVGIDIVGDLDIRRVRSTRRTWRLLKPLTVRWESGEYPGFPARELTVPADTETDLASVPPLARPWVAVSGPHDEAAVVHDYLYQIRAGPRSAADALFRDTALAVGVSAAKAWTMWAAVRAGGWWAWYNWNWGRVARPWQWAERAR